LTGDADDAHSRYLEATVSDFMIGDLHLPNGNPAEAEVRLQTQLVRRLHDHAASLVNTQRPAILCDDYNVVPTQIDAVVPQRWTSDAVYFPESRATYIRPRLD
jgi:exodeoxyribonuclease-3